MTMRSLLSLLLLIISTQAAPVAQFSISNGLESNILKSVSAVPLQSSGTLIIAVVTRDGLVISADTRRSDPFEAYVDTFEKIMPVGRYTAIAISGTAYFGDPSTARPVYEPLVVAAQYLRHSDLTGDLDKIFEPFRRMLMQSFDQFWKPYLPGMPKVEPGNVVYRGERRTRHIGARRRCHSSLLTTLDRDQNDTWAGIFGRDSVRYHQEFPIGRPVEKALVCVGIRQLALRTSEGRNQVIGCACCGLTEEGDGSGRRATRLDSNPHRDWS